MAGLLFDLDSELLTVSVLTVCTFQFILVYKFANSSLYGTFFNKHYKLSKKSIILMHDLSDIHSLVNELMQTVRAHLQSPIFDLIIIQIYRI